MLGKENRLRKKKDIFSVFKFGSVKSNDYFTIRYKKNDSQEKRFAILISLKVSKKAVERNRLRRQIRGILGTNLNLIKGGIDMVVIVKPSLLGKGFGDISSFLLSLLKKTGLVSA